MKCVKPVKFLLEDNLTSGYENPWTLHHTHAHMNMHTHTHVHTHMH